MQGSRECCPVCVRIPELFVRVPTAVLYATRCCVTSHDTSAGLFGIFQASNIGEWYTKKLFRSSSILLATLNFWWEFPFNRHPVVQFLHNPVEYYWEWKYTTVRHVDPYATYLIYIPYISVSDFFLDSTDVCG